MEVRGANTFPLLNRLPNLNLVAMTILSVFFLSVGFIDIFPFLLGINKVRWRLCCTSNARKRVESHFYRYRYQLVIRKGKAMMFRVKELEQDPYHVFFKF